ncbi:hypothetical protein ASE74_22935 [Pedobacter sp. Leaf216]|uniref:hypothetical protein n=1 Tax=Pedobacter sp. Leaf216 TaxID=1735684 RepID=UPI0006F68BEC|nr:hypothetical protein [Pedobacter sp. Leaf216]KQM72536.1 hypothetical protein ASE74_22935 [Pedobacter sp. Leaf216]
MKSSLRYALKVCLTTLLASAPLTMVIGFAYIALIRLINPANWMFSFNLPFNHIFLFVAILAAFIIVNSYTVKKVGYLRFINDRPVAHAIVTFILYLVASGNIFFMALDYLLFSYVPMFLTAFISSIFFTVREGKPFRKLPNKSPGNELTPLSDQ